MKILGVTAQFYNTAACLVEDGKLIAFTEEERFIGIKHSPFVIPQNAVQYCLKKAGVTIDDIDVIAVGFDDAGKTWCKKIWAKIKEGDWQNFFMENVSCGGYFLRSRAFKDYLVSLSNKNSTTIWREIKFISHHTAHASSAARCSGFDTCNILTLDGQGEDEAGFLGYFRNNKIFKLRSIPPSQSIGSLYYETTSACGFTPHSHEGKIMALTAYGNVNMQMLSGIAELTKDGYILLPDFARIFRNRFGKRKKAEPLSQQHKDLAATVQFFLENAAINLVKKLYRATGLRNLVLAGGVALNCDMNAKILSSGYVDQIFIQPAAHDAGTALGAALECYAQLTDKPCQPLDHVFYGPDYSDEELEKLLKETKNSYKRINSLREVAEKINEGKIVAWFQGRQEFGPRALGNRSILAHPGLPDIKNKINEEVKHRETWRPFAPSVLAEYANEYFINYYKSPYMILTFKVKTEKIKEIQAVLHIDGTARVQEVTSQSNSRYYDLIEEFYKLSGIPMVLNTSFNDREKPICLTPQDALKTFFSTGIDVLVINNFLLEK